MIYKVRFLTDLRIKPSWKGDKYYLAAPLRLLWAGEELIVPSDYDSDFASIPRCVWSLFPPHFYPWASVVHDWCYDTRIFPRKIADNCFLDILFYTGASQIYALTCYSSVRLFGRKYWNSHELCMVNSYRAQAGLALLKSIKKENIFK